MGPNVNEETLNDEGINGQITRVVSIYIKKRYTQKLEASAIYCTKSIWEAMFWYRRKLLPIYTPGTCATKKFQY